MCSSDLLRRQPILKIESAQAAEVDVEDDAIRLAGDFASQKFFSGSERLDADAVHTKRTGERRAQGVIVVDDANPRRPGSSRICQTSIVGGGHPIPKAGHNTDDPPGGLCFYWTLG